MHAKNSKELVPNAIANLGYRWSSCAAGGAMSFLLRYVVETHNIRGVASKYQELMDNDEQQDMPLIRKLRNGHNKTVEFHRDKMNMIVAQLLKPTQQATQRSIICHSGAS